MEVRGCKEKGEGAVRGFSSFSNPLSSSPEPSGSTLTMHLFLNCSCFSNALMVIRPVRLSLKCWKIGEKARESSLLSSLLVAIYLP
jgi:hypothetical protein